MSTSRNLVMMKNKKKTWKENEKLDEKWKANKNNGKTIEMQMK